MVDFFGKIQTRVFPAHYSKLATKWKVLLAKDFITKGILPDFDTPKTFLSLALVIVKSYFALPAEILVKSGRR